MLKCVNKWEPAGGIPSFCVFTGLNVAAGSKDITLTDNQVGMVNLSQFQQGHVDIKKGLDVLLQKYDILGDHIQNGAHNTPVRTIIFRNKP